ncbi:MAG: hypothetical protein GXZ07_01655 [Firmicutes bacterium]|nr:hypothetical protein [Bacillota bacterium]
MYSKLVERVTNMLEDSLRYSEEKLGEINALELLKKNDTEALGYFRYSLAMQAGNFLGENSEHVLEVFVCPEEADEEITATLPLTLVVRVEKHTAALASIAEALQNVLLEEYRKLLSPLADNLALFLKVYFVDEDDFLRRKGLAAAVGSLYAPALRVWRRSFV